MRRKNGALSNHGIVSRPSERGAIPPLPAAKRELSGRDDTLVGEYRTFEKAANAELERSVGSAIERTMEQALPNLRRLAASHQNADWVNG